MNLTSSGAVWLVVELRLGGGGGSQATTAPETHTLAQEVPRRCWHLIAPVSRHMEEPDRVVAVDQMIECQGQKVALWPQDENVLGVVKATIPRSWPDPLRQWPGRRPRPLLAEAHLDLATPPAGPRESRWRSGHHLRPQSRSQR